MDYYKILNLSRNATYDEINESFKTYASMHIINSKKDLTFTYLCQAYEILSDKNLRIGDCNPSFKSFASFTFM